MIRSMTAFARVSASAKEGHWVVEIRSVNHRYFEFSAKLPGSLNSLEGKIRDLIYSEIKRGKVVLSLDRENGQEKIRKIALNDTTVKAYLKVARTLQKQFKIRGDFSIADFLKLPGIFHVEESAENPQKDWKSLEGVLKRLLAQMIRAKELEGGKLAKDILGRLKTVRAAVQKIEACSKGRSGIIFSKLSERVGQLLADKEKDPERLHREVAFLADRSDITEEVVRMKSHLDLFENRIRETSEVGRELDFLCQEIHREINTMGSKAQLFEISTEVVFVKGELEKIREQVQNIE